MNRIVLCCAALLLIAASSIRADQSGAARPAPAAAAMSAETRQKLVEALNRGAAYLKQQQKADGTWENHPGVTGMAATALLKMPGRRDAELKTVDKTLAYLRKLAKPDGGIYDKDIPHYITAV
jgi:squalene cyclase